MPKNLQLNDYYSTSDLALATAISLWHPIEVIDRTNPNKAEFLFKREDGIDKVIEAFWKRQLKIDALTFFNQLKAVKAQLYERG